MGNCFGKCSKVDESPIPQPDIDVTKPPQTSEQANGRGSGLSSVVPIQNERNPKKILHPPSFCTEGQIFSPRNLKAFTLDELRNATQNFLAESLLGQGGFGYVYKGWINKQNLGPASPQSGMAVAVKKLKVQGVQGHKEWLSEVTYLSQLHHPNLVKLIGYCLEGDNRLLVYEFMPKGSLENHLFQRRTHPLSWETRIKIAIAAARGLCFLHESKEQVIYRDFKASNILLDSEFNAKLSDFGLAKAGPTGSNTHVTTQVMGTHGYAAPEYIATGQLSARCDVYSFGVVLLEILSGRRAVDKTKAGPEEKLLDWIKPYLGDKQKVLRIMDTKMEGQYSRKGAYMAILVALQCISDAKNRPQMAEVLELLEKILVAKSKYLQSRHKDAAGSSRGKKASSTHSSVSPMNKTPKDSPKSSSVHTPTNRTPEGSPMPSRAHTPKDSPMPSRAQSPMSRTPKDTPTSPRAQSPILRSPREN